MRRGPAAALLAILVAAVVVRFLPLVPFAVWGSDSGEYYLLTERLVETGRISFAYDGWGIAYPYFPGQFVIDGAAETVLGLSALDALRLPVPFLAAVLIPLGTWLLARRLTGDLRIAGLAAAFVALTPVDVLVTSHPMPGTLGHVFALAGLVALAHAYDDRRFLPFALVFALALVPSHHLSTWFFAGAVAAILLFREAGRVAWDRDALAVEVPVLLAAVLPTGVWWLGVATPFREGILGALGLPPLLVALAGYALLLLLPLAVVLRRRAFPRATLRAGYIGPYGKAALIGGLAAGVVAFLLVLFVTRVPGGNIHPTPASIAYSLPVVGWLAFALVGLRILHLHRRGALFIGWAAAIMASFVFGIVTESRVLFPFRHPDYLVEALAVPLALGMVATYDDLLVASTPREKRTVRRGAVALVTVLVAVTFLTSQPPREAIGGFEEGTTHQEFAMVLWAAENVPGGATVAADHRLSSMLFGFAHLRPTWDSATGIYHAADWNETAPRLRCADVVVDPCARIDHVVLTSVIEDGVITVQWEDARPMSDAAKEKFLDREHFEPLYAKGRDPDAAAFLRVRWE